MAEKIAVGYLFPGQGAQYIGMGKDIYEAFPEARRVFDEASDLIGFDLKSICFNGPSDKINQTRYSQPAIFVTSMASLAVFKSRMNSAYEVKAVAGLSLGEATALVAANAIAFADGVRFVKDRGLFMDEAAKENPGTMAAILGLDVQTVEKICLQTHAEVGNLNSPGQVVISGRPDAVHQAVENCKKAGASRCVELEVSGAFHSSCMSSACKRIEEALKTIPLHSPQIPVVSNLTAQIERDPGQIKKNLVMQMNHRTLWEDSMRRMIDMGVRQFFEIGPGKVLKGLMRRIDSSVKVQSCGVIEDFDHVTSK